MKGQSLVGRRFGRLLVVRFDGRKDGALIWECVCDCTTVKRVSSSNLQRTRSCGCLRAEITRVRSSKPNRRDGDGKKTVEVRAWEQMWSRVRASRKRPDYKTYVLRGIKVCRRWKSFDNFLKDMGPRPPGTSLDRKRNAGNYTPKNCRWATASQQAQNRRDTRWFRWLGRKLTLRQLASEVGVKWYTIYERLQKGWPLRDAVLKPYVRNRWSNR
jgi:hypothetical protein